MVYKEIYDTHRPKYLKMEEDIEKLEGHKEGWE